MSTKAFLHEIEMTLIEMAGHLKTSLKGPNMKYLFKIIEIPLDSP